MNWRGSPWFGVVAAIVTGALFAASLDVGPAGPLALVAPIPLLVYAMCAPRTIAVAFAAAGARVIAMAGIIYVYGDAPLAAKITIVAIFALVYTAVVLLTRWTARTAGATLAVFSYPLLLVTAELILGAVSPDGTFGAMGYSLVDVLPLLQVASLGGMSALTFCVALLPMAVAVVLARPESWRAAAVAGAVPLLLAAGFGALRLTQAYDSTARVALVGLDKYEARAYRGEKEAVEAAAAFAEEVHKLALAQPDYIVAPEKQLGGARDAAASSAQLAAAVGELPVTLVAGFDEVLPQGTRVNSAQVFAPGQPMQRYLKRRFIPGLETGYSIGTNSMLMGTRGVAICKDMDFPGMIREYGQNGVELLLVPAWDFVLDGRYHSRMALLRGVENGFAIARAAAAGRLTASDRYGRVIDEAITSPTATVTVVTELGLRGGGTWYSRLGDVFGWACAVCAFALLVRRGRYAMNLSRGVLTNKPQR